MKLIYVCSYSDVQPPPVCDVALLFIIHVLVVCHVFCCFYVLMIWVSHCTLMFGFWSRVFCLGIIQWSWFDVNIYMILSLFSCIVFVEAALRNICDIFRMPFAIFESSENNNNHRNLCIYLCKMSKLRSGREIIYIYLYQ